MTGNMVQDTVLFPNMDDSKEDTPVRSKMFEIKSSTETLEMEQDGYIGIAPYTN